MCFSKTALKMFMLVINVILFLCGGVVLALGIWAVADKIYITDLIGGYQFANAAYLMVIAGTILFLISFLGCLGAISGKKVLVIIFLIVLVIVFILLMTTAILAAIFQEDIESNLQQRMSQTISEQYGYDISYNEDNQRVTASWDKAQTNLECCGVVDHGWYIYQTSRWFQQQNNLNPGYFYGSNININMGNQKYVPESCCVYSTNMGQYLNVINCQSPQFGPPRTADLTAARNDALHYKGCYAAAREFVSSQSTLMLGIGFSFCVFLITGIVISIMFFCKLNSGSEYLGDREPMGYR